MTREIMRDLAVRYDKMAEEERRSVPEYASSREGKNFMKASRDVCDMCMRVRRRSNCDDCWISDTCYTITDAKKNPSRAEEYKIISALLHEKANAEGADFIIPQGGFYREPSGEDVGFHYIFDYIYECCGDGDDKKTITLKHEMSNPDVDRKIGFLQAMEKAYEMQEKNNMLVQIKCILN